MSDVDTSAEAVERLSYTLTDAASVTGLSVATLYRHAKAQRLRLFKVGGRTLVCAASLRALLTERDAARAVEERAIDVGRAECCGDPDYWLPVWRAAAAIRARGEASDE
jgi:hypothetical protein